jgi:O-antigen ligase
MLLIISCIAIAVAGFSNTSYGIWKAYFFEPVLVFILVLNVFKNNTNDANDTRMIRIDKVLWPLAVSMLLASLVAVYQKLTGQLVVAEFWPRVTGVFPYPNALGLYLGPLVLITLGWLAEMSYQNSRKNIIEKISQLVISITVTLSIIAIVLARSEGALVAIAAGLVIFGLLGNKRAKWATIVFVVIASGVIFAYQPTRDYAIKKATLRDLSGEIRKQQWRETVLMLNDGRELLGSGLANYQQAIAPYHQEGIFFNKDNDPEFHRHVVWDEEYHKAHWQPVEIYMYPHNILLNFWTELGLAGTLLFIWIIVKYFAVGVSAINSEKTRAWLKNKRSQNNYLIAGLLGAITTVIVHGLVDVPYFKNDLAAMFWVFVALLSLIKLNQERKTKDKIV